MPEAFSVIWEISIHAPRTGSDTSETEQTTADGNFNPRSPHGERLLVNEIVERFLVISIHAPRTGSDQAAQEVT